MRFQGSAWKPNDLERSLIRVKEECPNAVLVFLRDNDAPGEKKAKDFQEACFSRVDGVLHYWTGNHYQI